MDIAPRAYRATFTQAILGAHHMPDSRHLPSPQVLLTELGDGSGVLLNLETKFYYTLNPTAVFVWKALADCSAQTAAQLSERLAAEFQVEAEAARGDVEPLLASMIDEGLAHTEP